LVPVRSPAMLADASVAQPGGIPSISWYDSDGLAPFR
jgi:hypothetical protein